MGKNQVKALIIIAVAFFVFFYLAYLNYEMSKPMVNLLFFLLFLTGTITSIVLGNSGSR